MVKIQSFRLEALSLKSILVKIEPEVSLSISLSLYLASIKKKLN